MAGGRRIAVLEGLRKGLWGVGVARGASTALIVNLTGVGLGLVAQLVLARILGAEQFGIYAYVLAWVTVISLLASMAYGDTLMRLVPAYRVEERWGLLRGLIRHAAISVVVAGFGIFAVGAAAVMLLFERTSPELAHTFVVGFATVPIFALAQIRSSLARSLGRVLSALAPMMLVRQSTVVLALPFFALVLQQEMTAPAAMAINFVGALLALGLLTVSTRSAYPPLMRSAPIENDRAFWRQTSLHLLLVTGTQQAMNQSDILLLGWLADTTDAGVYIVVNQITYVTILTLIAMNQLIAPNISALYAKQDLPALQNLVTSTSWWIFGLSLLVSVPVFIFAYPILSIAFGDRFADGALALRFIIIGQLVNCSFGAISFLLTMTGHPFKAVIVFGSMATVSIILNVILIPLFGIEGAAAAKAFTLFGWNTMMAVIVFRDLQIIPGIYDTFRRRLLSPSKSGSTR